MKNKSDSSKDDKSIRSRLVGAVLIPSITLIVLWTVGAAYLVFDAFYVKAVVSSVRDISIPAVTGLVSAEKERQLGMAYLGKPATGTTDLHNQEQQTDQSFAAMRTASEAVLSSAPPEVGASAQKLYASIDQLPKIRAQIDTKSIDKAEVYTFYNTLLDNASSLFDTQGRILPVVSVALDGATTTEVFRATDQMSRGAALVSAGFAANALAPEDFRAFTNLVGTYHAELDKSVPFLRPDIRGKFQALFAGDTYKQLVAAENALIEHGVWTKGAAGLPVNEATWNQLSTQVLDQLTDLTISNADEVSSQAISDANQQLTWVVIGSIVALIAAIGAIVAAVRVSRTLVDRTLVTRLARLRDEALALAQHRLPDIVRRLREGEPVNVRAEMPDLDYGRDEIGQVADAFNAAQYTAVTAAVTEAQARDGVHNVFLSIAHRNQGLVHRQLKILDTMERGEENPQQLERLFQLDHLATRARRNAENLIILGGELPGRRWRKPVKLVDVLRAAVSETELYHRVQVERGPDVSVIGSAVADTIHLIAELVDNATSFSPPRSQVLVSSTLVARGAVVEVEDQGLGMSEEDRDRANRMMAESPEFDAMALKSDSRLGLFVIARLANRLEINVEFRVSPYGGTRAIVLLPSSILASGGSADRAPETVQLTHQHPVAAAESEAAAVEPESSELDEFWALSRSRLADKVQTTESLHGALDPIPPGADIADRLNPDSGSLPVPTGVTRWPEAEDVDEAPPPLPAIRPQLPQRQPQNSLAPQLRGDLDDEPELEIDDDYRSPEEIRHTMSAYQAGSLKGRQAGEYPDSRA
ncbi:sensor histidine kinase [Kutzneria chonburiensis]|uniref:histidine kinase n=1 Tax=Kutzneria chonburiensis TaxID=1483604 RepID=A0ABV6MIR0_9PSEU|nr:nitrate- and nitrite sensing domain-containing protein [Kutzneria chonburiensis]